MYYIVCYIAYIIISCNKAKWIIKYDNRIIINKKGNNKNYIMILACSIIFGLVSIASSKIPYQSDRKNYALRFYHYNDFEDPWTAGLNLIANFLHLFTKNPQVLFFSISFLFMMLTFIAYYKFKIKAPDTFLFLGLSQYYIYSFYLLKQAPAIAIAAISIAYYFNEKYLWSIIILIISTLFHESAIILFPLYIIMWKSNKKWVRYLGGFLLIVCVVAFSQVSRTITSILSLCLPNIFTEVEGYLDLTGAMVGSGESNILTVVKGAPYYLITGFALLKRKELRFKIKKYDQYLLLSMFSSSMIFLSIRMYWMWRFATYTYFPMFIFLSMILNKNKNKIENIFMKFCVGMLLFFISFRYLCQIFYLYGGF